MLLIRALIKRFLPLIIANIILIFPTLIFSVSMSAKIIRLLFAISLLLSTGAYSQQYYFKNYSAENGMPFVQVYAIFQDSRGFLYTGGYNGLSRFDGKQFVNFNFKMGLADNYVTAICEDKNGRIIAATKKGLSIIENNKVSKEKITGPLTGSNVACLEMDKNGDVLLGTASGLFLLKDQNVTRVEGTDNFDIKDILLADDVIYCATTKGVLMVQQGKARLITVKDGLSSNSINCLSISLDKYRLAIGTLNGLNIYDLNTGKIVAYFVENGLIDNNISCLFYESDNSLWIGSQTGLIKFENKEFNYYNIYYDNNSNIIRCILRDMEGNMWFGTHGGIYRFRDKSFSTFDKMSGPGNAFIFEIFQKGEDLFVCSENNGIYKYTQGYFKKYGAADGLPSNVCRSGGVDRNGRVFFETDAGVFELKNEHFFKVPISKRIKAPHYKLFCDRDNVVWVGGVTGISTFSYNASGGIDTNFMSLPTRSEEYTTTDICEDDEGYKWLAAYQAGLYRIKGTNIEDYGKKLGLPNTDYVSVRNTAKTMFVATLNGLMAIDLKSNTYKFIKSEDGLISDIIYSIGFAKGRSVLWVGTNIGISSLDVDEYERTGKLKINSYGKNEGFAGIECNTNGVFEDDKGAVWFGTISGLIKYLPNNYQPNRTLNKTNIYNFKLGDIDTVLKSGTDIKYRNNNITFYYRGICLTDPDKVLYRKKLEGYDKVYSLPSEDDNAKYSNLTPGTYTFYVISSNNEGVWNEEPTAFVFTILTPFYRTWWFVVLVAGFTIFSVYIVFKIRLNNIKNKQQKNFERKVEMSKIELKALRSQMNPHFVFNSLNSIQHYIFNSKSDEAVKYLNKFAKLMRVILNNSDKPTVAIEDDLEALKLYLELEQMRFEDKFEYKFEIDKNVDLDYDIMPPMLLQPYVENAILHGLTSRKDKGLLTIGIRNEEHFIICTITDNGIGRKKSAEIKRTMPGTKHKSFGMKITEERLRILNEISLSQHRVTIIDLENEDGSPAGTTVELYVPIL
jgi:ligand-binding sensor domain-containing protein/two-component sensor histidine kinase